jgi:hypothetical protein
VELAIVGRPVGSSLVFKDGSIGVTTVGCALEKLLGSLEGRLEVFIIGLALGSSLGCVVGIFD